MKHWTLDKQIECRVKTFPRKDEIDSHHWTTLNNYRGNYAKLFGQPISASVWIQDRFTSSVWKYFWPQIADISVRVSHEVAGVKYKRRLYSQTTDGAVSVKFPCDKPNCLPMNFQKKTHRIYTLQFNQVPAIRFIMKQQMWQKGYVVAFL